MLPRPRDSRVVGPVTEYLRNLLIEDPAEHDRAVQAVRALLNMPEGAMLLELLEKAVLYRSLPAGVLDGALREHNGQATLTLEITELKHAILAKERTGTERGNRRNRGHSSG